MIIFDIGANVGNYTQTLLNKYPTATIVVVEANPNIVRFLMERFKHCENVKIIHHAVSDESEKIINFYINNTADTISTASENWVKNSRFSAMRWDQTIQVDTITIEDIVEHYGEPDIIKIDVEGYELSVINGMKNSYGILSFEWAEEELDSIIKCCEKLKSIGYIRFSYIETDSPYDQEPKNFYSYDEFCELFYSQLNQQRKEKWGMVFAKKNDLCVIK